MADGVKTSLDYFIEYAYIENESLSDRINIAGMVIEINIYEHIDKPYLTGSVLIADNNNIISDLNISGVEKLRIRIRTDASNDVDSKFSIERVFVINEIQSGVKSNDYNEVFQLNLIEESGYISRVTRVSKSYTDYPQEIIKKIAKDYLKKEVKVLSNKENKEAQKTKIIVPNIHPLDAMSWIKNRTSTKNGAPFFLYSVLADDKLRYIDLESILSAAPLNTDKEYVYSQTFGSVMSGFDTITQSYIIQGYKAVNNEDQLTLADAGMAGATYSFLDTTKNVLKEKNFDISKVFNDVSGSFNTNQKYPVYDAKGEIAGNKLHKLDSRQITQVTTSNIYEDQTFNYYESASGDGHMLKPKARALHHYLHKSAYDINVPGKNFFYAGTNKSIGNIISISFKNTREQSEADAFRDNKRSGLFMIYAARHIFGGQKYTVTLTCVKLSHEKGPSK